MNSSWNTLPALSQISLHGVLILMGVMALLVAIWQVRVLRGESMKAVDGSRDDWHEQKIMYGIAVADLLVAIPMTFLGIGLIYTNFEWGYLVMALSGMWFLWANVMGTATSLRFENPTISLMWIITFPTGAILGVTYLLWMVIHFDKVYL